MSQESTAPEESPGRPATHKTGPKAGEPLRILYVEDDPTSARLVRAIAEKEGYAVSLATNQRECLKLIAEDPPGLLLIDLTLPDVAGLDLLARLRQSHPGIPAIIVTASDSIQDIIGAMQRGAADYLTKPVDARRMIVSLGNAVRLTVQQKEIARLRADLTDAYSPDQLVGSSTPMEALRKTIRRAAASEATVLIIGESGTGKELVAKALHYNSGRRERPFIALNCAALPETLIESELFGHEKGSFTDATARRVGQFELANTGTLFLDEIGDLSAMTQAKLLRVLQEREFTRVGGVQSIKVDVRIVTATNKNLEELVRKGQFREDLFYRINVIALYLPPLRERGEDVPLLAKHFLAKRIEEEDRPSQEFSKDAVDLLSRYPWPGNVREMENIIEQAFIWSKGSDTITPEHLPAILKNDTRSSSLRDDTLAGRLSLEKAVMEFEREIILDALKRTSYIQTHAANLLGISRRMLKYRMDTLGIGRPDQEVGAEPQAVVQE
jgi:DNA-binding NtrC family response regulator